MSSPAKRNVLKKVAPAVGSILKTVLPEQIHFNETLKRHTKSKIGPYQSILYIDIAV